MPIIDYHERLEQARRTERLEVERIQKICNASLRCAARCPYPLRTPDKCDECGNVDCMMADMELSDLWSEKQ